MKNESRPPQVMLLIGVGLGILVVLIITVLFLSRSESSSEEPPSEIQVTQPQKTDDSSIPPNDESQIRVPTYSDITLDPSVPVSPYYSDEYKEGQDIIDEAEEEEIQQSSTTGELLYELPYQGDTFSLDYDYSTFQYVLTLPRDNQSQGMEEFELYLEENGIEDPSWLQQLRIETVSELEPVEPKDEEDKQQEQSPPEEETEQEDEISEEELLEIESL